MTSRRKITRPGRTAKVSVSLDRVDVAMLRRVARRRHGDNFSAALAEGVHLLREQEGRHALVSWLGDAGAASATEREAIRREWRRRTLSGQRQGVA